MEGSMKISTIDKAVKRGCDDLGNALSHYWPGKERNGKILGNEMSERNISFYVARSLSATEFYIFMEPSFNSSNPTGDRSLDFLAVHQKHKCVIAAEAKRLYSSQMAGAIVADFIRIERFNIAWSDVYRLPNKPTHGLILATTWQENIAEWWIDPKKQVPSSKMAIENWRELRSKLARRRVGREKLQCDASLPDGWKQHYALYAIFGLGHDSGHLE